MIRSFARRGNNSLKVLALTATLMLLTTLAASADNTELVPGTAVLLNQAGSGNGGNGGNTSSVSTQTNIFAPASYADYKRHSAEPTIVVDRYPFKPGQFGNTTAANQYRDIGYSCAPVGVPTFSYFWRSFDGAQTWRLPPHDPAFGKAPTTGVGGGGDCHLAIGQVTHKIFFSDLPLGCLTMNVSSDLGTTWTEDPIACGLDPDVIDDREWNEVDETATTPNVYMSFIKFSSDALILVRSEQDGAPGSFADPLANPCNSLAALDGPQPDATATPCPDPRDSQLVRAGPVVADKSPASPHQHDLYIPFIRNTPTGFQLYVAISRDEGRSWTRRPVAARGPHDPSYDFPVLQIDTAGNLYYTWVEDGHNGTDETDAYYAFSTDAGLTWSPAIPLTQEKNDSAIFPWIAVGDPGQVDIVFYKSNSGANPNASTGVWNVYFAQSQNALNTGSNFKTVQISDRPNHVGPICNSGLGCAAGSRALLDFFTIDIDHYGAAWVNWSTDNNSRRDAFGMVSRQIAGNSVFKNQSLNLMNTWPVRDHTVFDPVGDTENAEGLAAPACPEMDVASAKTTRSGDLLTLALTLGAPPNRAAAMRCAPADATGGVWGAQFWASSLPDTTTGGGPNDNFYIAFRDNADGTGGEAGRLNSISFTITQNEIHRVEGGSATPCVPVSTPPPGAPNACTLKITASLNGLGIKQGTILSSVTPWALYMFGTDSRPPGLRVPLGFTQQADVAAPFDDTGTGTTLK